MKNFRFRLQAMCIALLLGVVSISAQEIRYVTQNGAGAKNGSSWANAYSDIQVAINDLVNNNKTGEVWVAAGTYYPTETTESSSSPYHKSFKIPAGITVRGGFPADGKVGDVYITNISQRPKADDTTFGAADSNTGDLDGEACNSGIYANRTILSGAVNNSNKDPKFVWDGSRNQFITTFYGNSYHVVWFAMNGFDGNGRANPLTKPAKLEGCVIMGGQASNSSITDNHPHNAYGGGIYMVANSFVYNCEVMHCEAARDGGGIYMDGGGIVRRTYVHDCQALGVGTEHGYGGGICEDGKNGNNADPTSGNQKSNPIVVAQSAVTNCAGRLGGGIALKSNQNNKGRYTIVANSTLVNNNTATVEGGGVYTDNGGGCASLTIVNNNCAGSGILQNGVTTGRAGGLYCRDNSYVGNCVIWGNTCAANNDVQYASSRSSNATTEKSKFYYNAVSHSEITDWTSVEKMGTTLLNETNSGEKKNSYGYPLFKAPTKDSESKHKAGYFDGYFLPVTNDQKSTIATNFNWTISSESALTYAGINTADLDVEGLTPAPTVQSYDMQLHKFNPRPSLGALVAEDVNLAPADASVTYDGVTYTKSFFVDPEFTYGEENTGKDGVSWTNPARFLGNVLNYISKQSYGDAKVAVFVKQGTVDNTCNESVGRVRNTAIEIPSNVSIFGSFDAELTEKDLSKRNPVHTPTIISGKLMNDYKYNVAHLININDKSNVLIDGFQIRFANAFSTELGNTNQNGAAITIKNATANIVIKNVAVANCQAYSGAAILADASTVKFENCILHNNTTTQLQNSGIVYGINGSNLTFDHCDVVRNVGHASYLDGTTTNNWQNSIFYGNLDRPVGDTNIDSENADPSNEGLNKYALAAFDGNTTQATGHHCMFDANSASFEGQFGGNDTGNQWQYNLQYAFTDGTGQGYPRFVNPTKNAGYSIDGDATYYGRAVSYEPHNNNPIVNKASYVGVHTSWGTDFVGTTRDFGGLPDIGAVESFRAENTTVENANLDGQPAYGQALYVRQYAGETFETITLSQEQKEQYDGSSWDKAIVGNAIYATTQESKEIDVKVTVLDGYYIKNGNYYVGLNGNNLTRVNSIDNAAVFQLCDANGNVLADNAKPNQAKRLKVKSTGNTVYLNRTGSWGNYTYTLTTASSPSNATATINASNNGYTIRYSYGTSVNRYFTNANTFTGTTATVWTFVKKEGETIHKETITVDSNVRGLQYAVNVQNEAFLKSGSSLNSKKQVYVAAGTYTNKSEGTSVSQPYAYMVKEGVDVYGGFPKVGNPGMNERDPKKADNKTILQPQTASPYVTMSLTKGTAPKIGTAANALNGDMMQVSNWGNAQCVNADNTMDKTSIGRVLVQPSDFNVETMWDGFTIQNGYLKTAYMYNIGEALINLTPYNVRTAGGAGVLLQGNGLLANCEVKDNLILCVPRAVDMIVEGDHKSTVDGNSLYTYHIGGAGVFMTGSNDKTAIVENCEISRNQVLTKAVHVPGVTGDQHPDHIWMYGAGLCQDGGNVYNTIIHDNTAATIMGTTLTGMNASYKLNNEMILGAGAFIARGNFYNNTVVSNVSGTFFHCHNNHCSFSGIHVFDAARIYNTLVADNISNWGYKLGWTVDNSTSPGNGVPVSAFDDNYARRTSRDPSKVHAIHSFFNVNKLEQKYEKDNNNQEYYTYIDLTSYNDPDSTNIYLNSNPYVSVTVNYEDKTAAEYHTTKNIYYKSGENQYQLQLATATLPASPCINTGTENVGNAVIPEFDAAYTDRIKDCKIDIGAHESDGSATIAPHEDDNQLVFYVTPEGYGSTNGSNPENAACAPKLQKVIDAAARVKLQNPEKQVIVKVANGYDYLHPNNEGKHPGEAGYKEPVNFTYYATRTTDAGDQDVRVWSIMIPRGVEVWGGYSDVTLQTDANGKFILDSDGNVQPKLDDSSKRIWTNSDNGFNTRNITSTQTYFDSYYYNKEQQSGANTYHVVTFTDRVYDVNGVPFLKKDIFTVDGEGKVTGLKADIDLTKKLSSYTATATDEAAFAHMSDIIGTGNVKTIGTNNVVVSNRAVLDGIFVTGGNADGNALAGSSSLNANSYGGAAIVTDYAYVRNCIVMDNRATNGGGLALTDGALVSGSLIIENNATNMGGGLYVFEDGAKLNNGITVDSKAPAGQVMDYNMAHVITSTIAGNTAQQGGGIWFTDQTDANARFNSVAVWQNQAVDQANVYGMVYPEQPTEDETLADIYYPFSYSVIENVRASGTNNLDVSSTNTAGVRFVDKDSDVDKANDLFDMAKEVDDPDIVTRLSDFGYYGLTTYSLLCSAGMPVDKYNELKSAIAISNVDLLNTPRIADDNQFVEIGARALAKRFPKKQLMLRLFVARPQDVDIDLAERFMRLGKKENPTDAEQYYSQEGSSFAFPFNSLQHALDYIKQARNGKIKDGANAHNLPFEILVGKGTYYPRKDLNGGTKSVWSQTFAIPEGVTIIGGFDPQGGSNTYYGRYYKAKSTVSDAVGSIDDNVELLSTVTSEPDREHKDIARGIKYGKEYVENLPKADGTASSDKIEFQQWDILDIADRRAMADNNKNGIIEPWEFKNQTIISGNAVNGETDGVYHVMTAVADEDAVGHMPKVQETNGDFKAATVDAETGYLWKEKGQQISLNGLIITGGNALTYLSTALDAYGSYIFYQGAGLQVDGNRYKNYKNNGGTGDAVFHNSAAYGVGYRDIPVSITSCQFRNNIAGYGGAISTNGSLTLFGSSFEQNLAVANTETRPDGETWKDINGDDISEVNYPGQGGAILATRQLSAFNTLFANNEARSNDKTNVAGIGLFSHKSFRVPSGAAGTLRAAGGAIMMGSAAEHHIVNCDFVRNKANMYPAVFTMNPTFAQTGSGVDTHNYSQIINTVAWGNEVNYISEDANYKTAAKLMVNVGKKERTTNYIKTKGATDFYDPSFIKNESTTAVNKGVPSATDLATTDAETNGVWQEAAWFCAYEDGVGFKQNNANDLRSKIVYSPTAYAPTMIKTANNDVYQNCNIQIVADNEDLAGPNFGTPSVKAGYDGFMEGADWSPARINRLTDNGNGWIGQTVTDVKTVNFNPSEYQGAYSVTHFIPTYPEYKKWIAFGDEKYMQTTTVNQTETVKINGIEITRQENMPRISKDPTVGETKGYIDIGVYEYIKQPLVVGNEVDILWVSTKEHPENGAANGATWKTPTSDLQRAIETLLASRNGHKKEIRIMEGEYTPVKTYKPEGSSDTYQAFYIDTKSLNGSVITPNNSKGDAYYAQSITIKGGYSSTIEYDYDPAQYKTIIRQEDAPTGVKTDRLIYIADPTLRYAKDSYGSGNEDGAKPDAGDVTTMPVQIDGVTLINDKASASTVGSAIYYPDYADNETEPTKTVTEAHKTSVGGVVKYWTDETHTTPSENNAETPYPTIENGTSEPIENPAKIIITKTLIVGSGSTAADEDVTKASAVYIGKNGGSALIYNTVFHSNYGMALDAWNTVNVNNTFGLNKGMIHLQDASGVTVKSQMHNSAMWKNNEAGKATGKTFGDQIHFGSEVPSASADMFSYNSYTNGPETETIGNTALVDLNSNIGQGPNFVDPENVDIFSRNFDLKPSIRLLNKGDGYRTPGAAEDDPATHDVDESADVYEGKYADLVVNNKYDFSLASTTDKDVLNRTRIVSNAGADGKQRIDIGAYEFQGNLQKILYVDPNKSHDDAATGEDWEKAFGYGDLQNAEDLAAVYHMSTPEEEAYVFVKGNSSTNPGLNTNETLTLRDGVTTYGSIISSYTDWHAIEGDTPDPYNPGHNKPKYETVEDFIKDMTNQREGVASNAANKTIVTGIKTDKDATYDATPEVGGKIYDTPVVVDGFVVTDPNSPKTPVLDITNTSEDAVIVVRNVIVADNDMTKASDTEANIDVAKISNGLIYEALFRDNKAKGTGAVLRVANYPEGAYQSGTTTTRGFAVNVTVEGKTVGADNSEPVDGVSANGEAGAQIFKSITNSISNDGEGAYGKISNKGISGYFYNIADPNLNYQLTETSKYIDMCELDVVEAEGTYKGYPNFLPDNLKKFINYTTDRDLLGNPRLLTGVTDGKTVETKTYLLDRGAFETWKVLNTAKGFQCGDDGTIASAEGYDDAAHAAIKKHFYPHDGSVVYIMNNQNLVIDAFDPEHEVKPTPENPGFLLVKEGGNFYGNGRPVTAAFLAIERTVPADGAIVSVPYAMKYRANVAKNTTPTEAGQHDLVLLADAPSDVRYYDGSKRSDWKHIFQKTFNRNDPNNCWIATDDNDVTAANNGVFYMPSTSHAAGTYRFTAQGASLTDYIYTETTDASKSVTLTKYDDAESTNNGADFTDNLDMGWNCFGVPYLVSNYKPYQTATTAAHGADNNGKYMMQNPHTLWLYYDGKHTPDYDPDQDAVDSKLVDGDGGYYSVKSWKSEASDWHVSSAADARIWVGEGIFTQTAAINGDETLTFYRPVAPAEFAAHAKGNVRYFYDATGIVEIGDIPAHGEDGYGVESTEYYTVNGMKIDKPRHGVVIIRQTLTNGSVRTIKRTFK